MTKISKSPEEQHLLYRNHKFIRLNQFLISIYTLGHFYIQKNTVVRLHKYPPTSSNYNYVVE